MGFGPVYDYVEGKLDWLAAGMATEGSGAGRPNAGTEARTDVPTCRLDERLADVRDRVRVAGWEACVVVNDERVVFGLLRREELAGEGSLSIEKAMRPGPSTFRPYVPIEEIAEHMVRHEQESSPVTTSDGRLVGLLMREDAVRAAHELHAGGGHEHG
jgi:predicted transcriptional regulator